MNIHLPAQTKPLPVKPGVLQVHVRVPALLVQLALALQPPFATLQEGAPENAEHITVKAVAQCDDTLMRFMHQCAPPPCFPC
jgi:hypothetical protein